MNEAIFENRAKSKTANLKKPPVSSCYIEDCQSSALQNQTKQKKGKQQDMLN